MALKEEIEGYSVILFVPVRKYQGCKTPEDAKQMADEIASEARGLWRKFTCDRPEIEAQVNRFCEHCKAPWTEKSTAFNDGCCDADGDAWRVANGYEPLAEARR